LCNGDAAVGGIAHDVIHNFCDLLFQFVDKLLRIILLVLNIAQFLFPDTCELTTFEQFLANQVYEFDSRGSSNQSFALALDVVALEKRLEAKGYRILERPVEINPSDEEYLQGSIQK
jgi:hypothetical protein